MAQVVSIGGRPIGRGHPVYFIAEIGINHNGDVGIAKKLIDAAVLAGCEAVKFQKRTPEACVPEQQKNIMRETPWGLMTYLEYRRRVEFGEPEYREIDRYCKEKGVSWFASCWDRGSVEFIERFNLQILIVENALCIPMHIPLGVALTHFLAETNFPTIAHHHDFYWERNRFSVNSIGDILDMSFPPSSTAPNWSG